MSGIFKTSSYYERIYFHEKTASKINTNKLLMFLTVNTNYTDKLQCIDSIKIQTTLI